VSKYPFIPEYLVKALEDTSIPLIDVMHGYLKQAMLDTEELLHETHEQFEQDRLDGYMEALADCYAMTYNLSIDRANLES
jgi:hypothetical protein